MILDAMRAARARLMEQVLRGPGAASPELRAAAAAGTGLPPDLAALVEKIHRHAYQVTDEDMASLRGRYSDDVLFEIVVAAATGAAERRFLSGLQAVEEAVAAAAASAAKKEEAA